MNSGEENASIVKNIFSSALNTTVSGLSPMEELELKFDNNDSKDIEELRAILSDKLAYPSSQSAEIHMRANRLGLLDLRKKHDEVG
jgi:hypothetical protein